MDITMKESNKKLEDDLIECGESGVGHSYAVDLGLPIFSCKDELPGGLVDSYECCGQGCCEHEALKIPETITVEMALEALDSLDDFARMETGVVATGAIRVLVKYILQNHPEPLNEHTMKVYEWLIKT